MGSRAPGHVQADRGARGCGGQSGRRLQPHSRRLSASVPAPKLFPVAFNLVKPFLSEETRKKIHVLGGERPDSAPRAAWGPAPGVALEGGPLPPGRMVPLLLWWQCGPGAGWGWAGVFMSVFSLF